MTLTLSEVITQNTVGQSEGYPIGVPQSYSWYGGTIKGASAPSDFSAVTAWGQVYQEVGGGGYYNSQAKVYVANAKTYVHLRTTNEWVLVQDQATNPIAGGYFATDFAGNAATSMTITLQSDGSAAFGVPTSTYNNHFWPSARGTYAAGMVDAVYTQMDMKVDDPDLRLVANVGADWWRDARASYVDGFDNNPLAGMSNWVDLTTQWKTLGFYSATTDQIKANPPPIISNSTDVPTSTPTPTPIMDVSGNDVLTSTSDADPAPSGLVTNVGTGSDTLTLKISQDAYQGDAQYAVYVDGQQVGGTFTAKALHNSGQSDTLEIKGDWDAGNHTVDVRLLNDLWDGTPETDRNVYVEGATYNGAAVSGSKLDVYYTPQGFDWLV